MKTPGRDGRDSQSARARKQDVFAEGQQQQRFRDEEEHRPGREPDNRNREQHEDGAARNTGSALRHYLALTATGDGLIPP